MKTHYSHNALLTSVKIDVSVQSPKNHVENARIQAVSKGNYYVSDLIDGHIDFDQWEFSVVWATRISSFPVLFAVPPPINSFSLGTAGSLMKHAHHIYAW